MASTAQRSPALISMEDAVQAFPVNNFIQGKWVKFSDLAAEGFDVKYLFDGAGLTSCLEFSGPWYHSLYAYFWANAKQTGSQMTLQMMGKEVVVSEATIGAAFGCSTDGVTYDKAWEAALDADVVDTVLYRENKPQSGLVKNYKSARMTPLCRLIHNLLFNIITPRTGSRDYVSDRDRFCIYHIMQGVEINLPELVCYHWMQAFKDRSSTKKKVPIPYCMVFAQILSLAGVDLADMVPTDGGSQLTGTTFVKMGIADSFPGWRNLRQTKEKKAKVVRTKTAARKPTSGATSAQPVVVESDSEPPQTQEEKEPQPLQVIPPTPSSTDSDSTESDNAPLIFKRHRTSRPMPTSPNPTCPPFVAPKNYRPSAAPTPQQTQPSPSSPQPPAKKQKTQPPVSSPPSPAFINVPAPQPSPSLAMPTQQPKPKPRTRSSQPSSSQPQPQPQPQPKQKTQGLKRKGSPLSKKEARDLKKAAQRSLAEHRQKKQQDASLERKEEEELEAAVLESVKDISLKEASVPQHVAPVETDDEALVCEAIAKSVKTHEEEEHVARVASAVEFAAESLSKKEAEREKELRVAMVDEDIEPEELEAMEAAIVASVIEESRRQAMDDDTVTDEALALAVQPINAAAVEARDSEVMDAAAIRRHISIYGDPSTSSVPLSQVRRPTHHSLHCVPLGRVFETLSRRVGTSYYWFHSLRRPFPSGSSLHEVCLRAEPSILEVQNSFWRRSGHISSNDVLLHLEQVNLTALWRSRIPGINPFAEIREVLPEEEEHALALYPADFMPCILPAAAADRPMIPRTDNILEHYSRGRTTYPDGCKVWKSFEMLSTIFPFHYTPLSLNQFLGLCHYMKVTLPVDRSHLRPSTHEVNLNLEDPELSEDFDFWKGCDYNAVLRLMLLQYQMESESRQASLTRAARTLTGSFRLGTQHSSIVHPHTEFRLAIDRQLFEEPIQHYKGKELKVVCIPSFSDCMSLEDEFQSDRALVNRLRQGETGSGDDLVQYQKILRRQEHSSGLLPSEKAPADAVLQPVGRCYTATPHHFYVAASEDNMLGVWTRDYFYPSPSGDEFHVPSLSCTYWFTAAAAATEVIISDDDSDGVTSSLPPAVYHDLAAVRAELARERAAHLETQHAAAYWASQARAFQAKYYALQSAAGDAPSPEDAALLSSLFTDVNPKGEKIEETDEEKRKRKGKGKVDHGEGGTS